MRERIRETNKIPRKWEIAGDVGVTDKFLSTPKLWPVFDKEYKAATRRYDLSPVGRPQARKREKRERKAIAYQEVFSRSGKLPKLEDVAKHVGVTASALCINYPAFVAARRGLQAKGVRSDRPQNQPTGKEQRAIAYLKSQVGTAGRLPSVQDILRAADIKTATTLWRWDDFRREYREAKAQLVKATPWGKPLDFREGEAVLRLQQMAKATGQVPPIDDLAESLGVKVRTLNLDATLRRAYLALACQMNSKAESADGNGKRPPDELLTRGPSAPAGPPTAARAAAVAAVDDPQAVADESEAIAGSQAEPLVTLRQAAAMVSKSKRTLERYQKDAPTFPQPKVQGVGGTASEWDWSESAPLAAKAV